MRCRLLVLVVLLTLPAPLRADDRSVSLKSVGIDLSAVEDRTDLTFEESPAYYGILDHVRNVPAAELTADARELRHQRWTNSSRFHDRPESEFPTFVDLIDDPEPYRGRPVTLRGHVIRLVKYPAGPNDFGIETLYEAWLVTEDSQQHPTTVISTEIPPGMPIGEETINSVWVTGYFYKLRTYPSRDQKIRFAPMILAETLSWHPPAEADRGWSLSPVSIILLAGGTAGAIVVALWMSARRSRRERERRLQQSLRDQPPDFLKSLPG